MPAKVPASFTAYYCGEAGYGSDGEVFAVESDPTKVFKFCALYDYDGHQPFDKYSEVASVLGHLYSHPSSAYAKVYAYMYFGQWTKKECDLNGVCIKTDYVLYYYVMERLQKISEDERRVFHTIMSHEDANIEKNYSTDKVREMLTGLSKGLDFDAERVILFHDNYHNSRISHNDISPRNIMKNDKGDFKLIDFDRATFWRNNATEN